MASPEIEQIKERLNIAEVIGGYVQLQKAGRNYRARCPFHKERTPSFMVSPERGTYMCFGCGEKGDIFSFVEKMDGIDFRAALTQLADRAGVAVPRLSAVSAEQKSKEDSLRERLLACNEAAARFFEDALAGRNDVQGYISQRTVTLQTMRTWRLGYAPASWDALTAHLRAQQFTGEEIIAAGLAVPSEKKQDGMYDRFRGRIMFPLFDMGNRVVAFSGRFFEHVGGSREQREGVEPAKYVNSPETLLFKKSRVLYGLHIAKESIRKADCVLVVEGQFDVILAHQSGLRFTVAASGTALTREHLTLLSRYSKRLVLALDSDGAGLRSGLTSAAMALAMGFDVKIPKLPEGCKDPADTAARNPELLRFAVRESRTAVEFFLDALRGIARDERGYKKAVEGQILPLIAAIPSRNDQSHFVAIVASRLQVPEDAVRTEVARRPRLQEFPDEPEQAAASAQAQKDREAQALTRIERSAAMLLVRPDLPEDVRTRLTEAVGEERMRAIEEKTMARAEEFRFQFDAMEEGGDDVVQRLLASVIEEKVREDIAAARVELREAQRAGESGRELDLMRRIQTLTRKQHGH